MEVGLKEDNILYPMANRSLAKKVQDDMLLQFEQVNKKMNQEIEKQITFAETL